MNCKPGDLAIRIRSYSDSYIPVGAIIQCISLIPGTAIMEGTLSDSLASNVWNVEWNGKSAAVDGVRLGIPDAHLRPIRDQPGEDEMLRIAGLPNKQPEVA